MDAFVLTARLVMNDSEFDSSLAGKESSLSKWGSKVGKLAGAAFVTAFALGAKGLKSAVEKGMSFDQAMSGVKALSGATEDEFKTLRDKAIELGGSTKFTAEEVAEAFGYMAMAGWDTEKMLDGIEGVLNLSAASGEDLARTSDIVTDALTAFGLTADDTAHFTDVLAAAATRSNTTVGMMGEAFSYLAPVAGKLNMTVDDVAVALGLLANNGIKSSKAGTALNRLLSALIQPSDDAAKAMNKLGLSLFDSKGGVKSLSQLMVDFQGVAAKNGIDLKTLTHITADYEKQMEALDAQLESGAISQAEYDTQLKEIASSTDNGSFVSDFLENISKIVGVRGLPAFMALMGTTAEDYERLMSSITNSEGAAKNMSDVRMDNLAGDVTKLNSAIEGLQILVSDQFTLKLRQFVGELTSGIGDLSSSLQSGGLLGMFTNLTDWVINGITGALSDPNITVEGATKFGRALGTFVGHLVGSLVENGGTILTGLFEAGTSLASGMVDGLLYGLFGGGEGSLAYVIGGIKDVEQDAVDEANSNAVKAQGIVNYMESLAKQYGSAASNTAEWASALEQLKQVFPEVAGMINEETGALTATNEQLKAYIENQRQAAIADAKRKTIQGYYDAYTQKAFEQAQNEVQADIASAQAQEAWNSLVRYIQQYDPNYTGSSARSIEDLRVAAQSYANEHGDTSGTVDTLYNTYNEQITASAAYAEKARLLASEVAALQVECQLAEKAMAHMASEAGSFSAPSISMNSGQYSAWYYGGGAKKQAKGDWYVPYDNYPSLLHRGEMVLTASQARRYRDGGTDLSGLKGEIVAAIRQGMADAQVTARVNGQGITEMVNTITSNELKGRRFVT